MHEIWHLCNKTGGKGNSRITDDRHLFGVKVCDGEMMMSDNDKFHRMYDKSIHGVVARRAYDPRGDDSCVYYLWSDRELGHINIIMNCVGEY